MVLRVPRRQVRGLMAAKAAKRAKEKIGSGKFGEVYSTSPNTVTKEIHLEKRNNLLNEVDMQNRAASLGAAAQINELVLKPPKIGGTVVPVNPEEVNPSMRGQIVMQDLRANYYPGGTADITRYNLTPQQTLDQAKQMSLLALNNISLNDRHPGNIMFHKMTGRPIQLDFGISGEIKTDRSKAVILSNAVLEGMHAAGLKEEASILRGLVYDYIHKDPAAALDIAKQGLSRLQKIKRPIDSSQYVYATVDNAADFISPLGN